MLTSYNKTVTVTTENYYQTFLSWHQKLMSTKGFFLNNWQRLQIEAIYTDNLHQNPFRIYFRNILVWKWDFHFVFLLFFSILKVSKQHKTRDPRTKPDHFRISLHKTTILSAQEKFSNEINNHNDFQSFRNRLSSQLFDELGPGTKKRSLISNESP